jgi:hypothetical protein
LKPLDVRSEINLERAGASRYFCRQFFVSFDQWTGARNSREIREQLRCCNWIRLPMSQSIAAAIGEGGKEDEEVES